jgi:hypothetical protein
MLWQANPDEEATHWRAVCGRTARTVRREERASALSYPYQYVNPIRRIKILDASRNGTFWIPAFAGMTGVVRLLF